MRIQEIAKLAGVSTATVSRVFSHHPSIRPEVRAHVFEVARQHGYHPRLATKQRNVVIITPYNSIYPVQSCVDMILAELTQEFPRRDFRLEILPVNNRERLESIQFCAAVAIGAEPAEFRDWPERFAAPLVVMDRDSAGCPPGIHFVRSDEEQGMRIAIDHLYERGCRRIGCIVHGDSETGNTDIRRAAVIRALEARGLAADGATVLLSGPGSDKYVELVGKLLKQGADALFCPGGNAGIAVLYALSLYNRHVPDEVSLIASEQTFFSHYAVPPQTTVSPDYAAMAAAAADVIGARLDGQSAPVRTVLPYRLIVRESVGLPRYDRESPRIGERSSR